MSEDKYLESVGSFENFFQEISLISIPADCLKKYESHNKRDVLEIFERIFVSPLKVVLVLKSGWQICAVSKSRSYFSLQQCFYV